MVNPFTFEPHLAGKSKQQVISCAQPELKEKVSQTNFFFIKMWDLFIIVVDSFRVEEDFDEFGSFYEYRILARNYIFDRKPQEFVV